MERSEQINELAAALAAAQGKYKPVKRSGANPKFRSKYSTLDDVIAAVRKALSSEALAYSQLVGENDAGFILTTLLIHESGQFISSTMSVTPAVVMSREGKKVTTDLQALGSALTYTKRYQLASMLGVNAEIDDDGNTSGQQGNGRKKQAPPPQSAEAQAAQEEKRRIEAAREVVKLAWVASGKELGYLSDPPESDEWGRFYNALGDAYKAIKRSGEPEGGFDKLRKDGLALLMTNAPEPEQDDDSGDALDDDVLPPTD